MARTRIAHFAGPNATIQNTPPLVTSNKARAKHGLPLLKNEDGTTAKFDVLRAQRLARPVTLYVEQFSAHPLEADAERLYSKPDGYMDGHGRMHKRRQSKSDTPVYEIELRPEDGLYPLPYMARQVTGVAWDEECAFPGAPDETARQPFFPDGARSFEEIDRFGIGLKGTGNLLGGKAKIDFYRVLPPGGYRRQGERRGRDFFPYKPFHLLAAPARPALARAANMVQQVLASGRYDGAIWTEGSPSIEETIYWLNLVVDTSLPLCGNAAQRPHGHVGSDGPKNIIDSADYVHSRVWADRRGRNRAGFVMIQEQRIFAARSVTKLDARPGGYDAAGGHGGILGASGHDGAPLLHYLPTARHTYLSQVNITRLPVRVHGIRRGPKGIERVAVRIKSERGDLLDAAIPDVTIVKDAGYLAPPDESIEAQVELLASIDYKLSTAPLAGFVVEGWAPYGLVSSVARETVLRRAIHMGFPVVRVGRGAPEGFTPVRPPYIGGSNLSATKARILLIACLMKLGALPTASDPDRPTAVETKALNNALLKYQSIFDEH